MSEPFNYNNGQEDCISIAEECGLEYHGLDKDEQPIFTGSEEAFKKFEELDLVNPFYFPDPNEYYNE